MLYVSGERFVAERVVRGVFCGGGRTFDWWYGVLVFLTTTSHVCFSLLLLKGSDRQTGALDGV